MHFESLVVLAMSAAALAGGPHPPAPPISPSTDPALCLKRLETYPNRSLKRIDILGGHCLQARTYKGKFGPYTGDFFFETCCKDKDNKYTEPTFVNVDECLIFDPAKGALGWNNLKSDDKKIRKHCSQCELEQVDKPEEGQKAGPYLSCNCTKDDKKTVTAKIFLGTDAADAKKPKDSFWVNERARLVCRK